MKRFAYISFVIISFSYAQNQSINSVIKHVNEQLDIYQNLSPFGAAYYAVKDLKLTKAEVLEGYGDAAMVTDSLESIEALGFIQDKINMYLNKALKHRDASSVDFTQVFNDNLSVVKSEDHKLYNFSIDEKTGGSYRSRVSWMFYNLDGKFINTDFSLEENEASLFHPDGYDAIKIVTTHNTTRYLLFGNVRGCGACFEEHVTLVHFENGRFVLDFEYAVTSRVAEQRIFFDADSKALSVFYETDDLTPECYCTDENLEDEGSPFGGYDDDALETAVCSCLFEFNGQTFELTKYSAQIKKNRD